MLVPEVEDNWKDMAFTRNLNLKSSEVSRGLKERLGEFSVKTWNEVYHRYSMKLIIEEGILVLPGFEVRDTTKY